MSELLPKRNYTPRTYTPEQVAEAINLFMMNGGSVAKTLNNLDSLWGYAPSEPTLRKWLINSNEAMNLLDQRTCQKIQQDVAHVIDLTYQLLVEHLEARTFPPSKLPTLYGVMVDKYILFNKVRNTEANKDIVGDEFVSEKNKDILSKLIDEEDL